MSFDMGYVFADRCNYHTYRAKVIQDYLANLTRKEDFMIEKELKFRCDYCGEYYDTPVARAKCELECDRKRVAEEEKQLKEKLAKEKETRHDEIIAKRKELADLEQRYYKDYGVFAYTLREPLTKTVRFNGDWGKFFEDCFK